MWSWLDRPCLAAITIACMSSYMEGYSCGASSSVIQTIRDRDCPYLSFSFQLYVCMSWYISCNPSVLLLAWIRLEVIELDQPLSEAGASKVFKGDQRWQRSPSCHSRAHLGRYVELENQHVLISEHIKLLMESPASICLNLLCSMDFVATSCHST